MNIEELRDFCLSFPHTTESFPFDEETLVFKVAGKMFLLTSVTKYQSFNVKCNPEEAIELRERHEAIQPGYHMSKIHWNTIVLDGSLSNSFLKEQIQNSYDLVYQSLTKKLRNELENR
jgi:predicted DNA-binding protein (MmcQ/YjbR family)